MKLSFTTVPSKHIPTIEYNIQLECHGQFDGCVHLPRIRSSLQTKDREIAKLKALIFQKDNETLALSSSHKNALRQVWSSIPLHPSLSLKAIDGRSNGTWTKSLDWTQRTALSGRTSEIRRGENTFAERTATTIEYRTWTMSTSREETLRRTDGETIALQSCLKWLVSLLFKQSSEAKLMLKESGRERINAVYGTKEQCRKEFQDEIARLRHQFQLVRTDLFMSRGKWFRSIRMTVITRSPTTRM